MVVIRTVRKSRSVPGQSTDFYVEEKINYRYTLCMLLRLQKILSEQGVCSRRKAEEYLEAGLVKVNGIAVKIGDKADPEVDKIEVDGKVLKDRAEMLYYVMNKPTGVETTNVDRSTLTQDDDASLTYERKQPPYAKASGGKGNLRNQGGNDYQLPTTNYQLTVRDILPRHLQGKVFPVGRLDKDSSGLLLFTNDGVLAYRLTHPKFHHEKEYEVVVDRTIDQLTCKKIEKGFEMDGSQTKPLECRKVATNRARIVLTEGKNRQIRRMFQYVGYTVHSLKRIRIMNLLLDEKKLEKGMVRALEKKEKMDLLASVML